LAISGPAGDCFFFDPVIGLRKAHPCFRLLIFPFAFPAASRFNVRHMKIVLAYSGGLDTSGLLSWIKETYNAAMTFCYDSMHGWR
jgi:hypothetical protein